MVRSGVRLGIDWCACTPPACISIKTSIGCSTTGTAATPRPTALTDPPTCCAYHAFRCRCRAAGMKWWFQVRVLKAGTQDLYRGPCVYLFNHRSWGDFIVDQYATEGRSLFMSR